MKYRNWNENFDMMNFEIRSRTCLFRVIFLEYVGVRKLNISTNVPCMTIQQDTEHFLKIHCSISFNFGF